MPSYGGGVRVDWRGSALVLSLSILLLLLPIPVISAPYDEEWHVRRGDPLNEFEASLHPSGSPAPPSPTASLSLHRTRTETGTQTDAIAPSVTTVTSPPSPPSTPEPSSRIPELPPEYAQDKELEQARREEAFHRKNQLIRNLTETLEQIFKPAETIGESIALTSNEVQALMKTMHSLKQTLEVPPPKFPEFMVTTHRPVDVVTESMHSGVGEVIVESIDMDDIEQITTTEWPAYGSSLYPAAKPRMGEDSLEDERLVDLDGSAYEVNRIIAKPTEVVLEEGNNGEPCPMNSTDLSLEDRLTAIVSVVYRSLRAIAPLGWKDEETDLLLFTLLTIAPIDSPDEQKTFMDMLAAGIQCAFRDCRKALPRMRTTARPLSEVSVIRKMRGAHPSDLFECSCPPGFELV